MQGELPHMVCTKTIQNVPFLNSNIRTDFLSMIYYVLHIFTCHPIKRISVLPLELRKKDDFSRMCTKEMGKFSLHYITHHGRVANWKIYIPLVISTLKNSYLSYSLPDFSEIFTNMFL